jgi:3-hydroxyacyl-[acyl-carrier-protein] dehydratase
MTGAHPIHAVLAGTPHRPPMLLLDRLETLEPGRRGTARKAVTAAEPYCASAEPGDCAPTLLVDALGQLAIAVLGGTQAAAHAVWYLGSVEDMQFGAPARAGDVLQLEALVQRSFRGSSRVLVSARVEGRLVAQGHMVLSTGRN